MEGLGNDFIVVTEEDLSPYLAHISSLARKLCDRHFGIGADGIVVVTPSERAEVGMRIWNADGSEAEMCGNGIRCLAKFVFERGMVKGEEFTVETKAGIMVPRVIVEAGRVREVVVNMGKPRLAPPEIPVRVTGDRALRVPLALGERIISFTAVSMGNPHAVIFEIPPDWVELGEEIENHPLFPERVNVEFVKVEHPRRAVVKAWERGAGATLACGTGACAVLVAGVLNGVLEREAEICLPGGVLHIRWSPEGYVIMRGEVKEIFTGEIQDEVMTRWM